MIRSSQKGGVEQTAPGCIEFGTEGIRIYADSVSPYEPQEVEGLISRLKNNNLDLIFLNCFGFPRGLQTQIKLETGKPTILSNALVSRVLKEFIL